jgi:hypothetical protein
LSGRVDRFGFGPKCFDMFLPLLPAAVEVVDVDDSGLPVIVGEWKSLRAVDGVDDARVDIVLQ